MATQSSIYVYVIQHPAKASAQETLTYIEDQISRACAQAPNDAGRLVVLQELHNTPYFCQSENADLFDLAESIPGPTTDYLGEVAQKHHCVIVSSLFEKRAPGIYHNTSVVLDSNGEIAGQYRKMHIPDDPGFYEKFYFTPGDAEGERQGFAPIETSLGKLGVLVCWDQWYPEAARLMALSGADVLIYPTAIGWDDTDTDAERARQLDAWRTVQRGHAIANGLPVIVANRCGFEASPMDGEPGIRFWGHSFICGPQGEILCESNPNTEQILSTKLDLCRSEDVRRIWPFFRDRRVDAYQNLDRRYLD